MGAGGDGLEEGLRLHDDRGGSEGTSELWVLRGVVEGLRVLVGLRVWNGGGEGRGLILGKGVMVCAEHQVWLVL